MLIALLAVGMLNRTLPQLNIMAIGHNLNALLLLVLLMFSVGSIAWVFQDQMTMALEQMQQVLLKLIHSIVALCLTYFQIKRKID